MRINMFLLILKYQHIFVDNQYICVKHHDHFFRFSEITVVLNKPPHLGECDMTFNDTFSVLSRYDVECKGWQDPENLDLDLYTYYYYEDKPDGSRTKYILGSTRKPSIPAILPIGNS